jgi:hypothetical protein
VIEERHRDDADHGTDESGDTQRHLHAVAPELDVVVPRTRLSHAASLAPTPVGRRRR